MAPRIGAKQNSPSTGSDMMTSRAGSVSGASRVWPFFGSVNVRAIALNCSTTRMRERARSTLTRRSASSSPGRRPVNAATWSQEREDRAVALAAREPLAQGLTPDAKCVAPGMCQRIVVGYGSTQFVEQLLVEDFWSLHRLTAPTSTHEVVCGVAPFRMCDPCVMCGRRSKHGTPLLLAPDQRGPSPSHQSQTTLPPPSQHPTTVSSARLISKATVGGQLLRRVSGSWAERPESVAALAPATSGHITPRSRPRAKSCPSRPPPAPPSIQPRFYRGERFRLRIRYTLACSILCWRRLHTPSDQAAVGC